MRLFLLISFIVLGWIHPSLAQLDSLEYHVGLSGVAGSKGFAPHWITSNRYGIYNDSINDVVLLSGISAQYKLGKHFRFEGGLDIAIKYNLNQSFLYQGFLNVYYGELKLMMGRQEYTLGQYSEDLSSGSFLVSNNALPIPRIGIGFYDYVDVPFTDGYLQVKGALNHGWMENDRLDHSRINKPYLHEKFAYIRTQKIPINPYIGMGHFAIYGGETMDGTEVGIDYKAVFLAKGSSVPGFRGEEINVAGEHLGVLDLGFYSRIKDFDIIFYYQKPITDGTSTTENYSRNKDFFTGILIESKKNRLVSGFLYEFIHTHQQGGNGIPDPIVDGRLIVLNSEEDLQFLEEYYTTLGYPVEEINSESEWKSFLQAYTNYGYEFGGRVDFYNNYLYKHIYNNRIIGTPLFITKPQLKHMIGYEETGNYVINNRITAHHFGMKGYIFKNLRYNLKITYSSNEGNWQEYEGRYSWKGISEDPDFQWYWQGDKIQFYTMVETEYKNEKFPNLSLLLSLGYDFGDIYHNFGGLIGLKYQKISK